MSPLIHKLDKKQSIYHVCDKVNMPVLVAYGIVTWLKLPMMLNYVLLLVLVVAFVPLVVEIVGRIPVVRLLALGERKR